MNSESAWYKVFRRSAGLAAVAINTHLTRAYATAGMGGIREQYSQLTRRNAAVAIFLPFLLGTTAFSAVPLWLGEHQEAVVTVVTALALGIAVNVSTAVCSATMFAIGRSGLIGAMALALATVSVVLAIPLAVAFGFNGLVAAYAGWDSTRQSARSVVPAIANRYIDEGFSRRHRRAVRGRNTRFDRGDADQSDRRAR